MTDAGRPWRVVQWATGAVGKTTLRAVLDHPDLELVGLYVYSDRKVGKDAGEIARREPTGVLATHDLDEILALDADVVLHTARIGVPYESGDAEILALLESGKNVITTQGQHYPRAHGPEREELLASAARRGGVTLFGTGINPGVVLERLALTATGMCLDVRSITVREVVEASGMPSPEFVFDVMGMGSDPASPALLDGPLPTLYATLFSEAIRYATDSIGVQVERIEPDHEMFPATRRLEVRAGVIEPGTVAGTCWRWHAIVDGRRFLTLSINWIMDRDLPGFEDFHLWTVEVEGVPGIRMSIDLTEPPNPDGRLTRAEQYATAAPVVAAIPVVCQAPPGIFELPTLLPWHPSLRAQA
ncbi:MAG: dihydrodipicolinate reductase [Frankiales bacterium]|nr:dihydrodipicolinate reductase [Frankiales bacterium]